MKKLDLFKTTKLIIIIICILSVLVIISFILTIFTEYGFGNQFSFMALMLFILMIIQYRDLNKSFLHFDKSIIAWKLPSMNERCCIYLKNQPIEISKEQYGIKIKNGDNKINITSDLLSKKDIEYIYEILKEYYCK